MQLVVFLAVLPVTSRTVVVPSRVESALSRLFFQLQSARGPFGTLLHLAAAGAPVWCAGVVRPVTAAACLSPRGTPGGPARRGACGSLSTHSFADVADDTVADGADDTVADGADDKVSFRPPCASVCIPTHA